MTTLVTGAAGFIGMHTAKRLLDEGDAVVGVDDLNPYYDPKLKQARLNVLERYPLFRFHRLDISDKNEFLRIFRETHFDRVVHLAAQVGVRHSLIDPYAYLQSNLLGFLNVLECCRHHSIKHLVYASSSSVYGNSTKCEFSITDPVDHPISLYAATKRSNELIAYSYSHLFGIACTGLRFFTVYGPWGRPDMAAFSFTESILNGKPLRVFNRGQMNRDFTYIDDVVEGIVRLLRTPPLCEADGVPYRLYNIGNRTPIRLIDFIQVLEQCLGKRATIVLDELQPGDVLNTCADVSELEQDTGFSPCTPLDKGLLSFVEWYREYHKTSAATQIVATPTIMISSPSSIS